MTEDPLWPRASHWLLSGGAAAGPQLSVIGVPLCRTSISPSGADTTPTAVRHALRRFSTFHAELGVDLESIRVTDHGDLDVASAGPEDHLDRVAEGLQALGPLGDLVILIGGDNALTRPAMRTLLPLPTGGLLTLDAHHDVRDFHAGATNGTPVRGLIDDGLPGTNVVQVGIGHLTNSRAYRTWCHEQGIRAIGVEQARGRVGSVVEQQLDRLAATCTDLYVDLDVDVVDRTFAPGCPGADRKSVV